MNESLILDASLFCNMAIGKTFKDADSQIIGIEFSDDGSILCAYTVDTLNIYDISTAKKIKTLKNNVSKISILKFTHNPTAILLIPHEQPHDLLYWSIYENEIIKSFKGPTK